MHVLELAEGPDYVGDLPLALQEHFAAIAGAGPSDAGCAPCSSLLHGCSA